MIKEVSKDKKLYFCGGDGKFVSRYFKDSIYKKDLVFEGMKKVIKEMEIRC
jgi:type III pantothenate kinase